MFNKSPTRQMGSSALLNVKRYNVIECVYGIYITTDNIHSISYVSTAICLHHKLKGEGLQYLIVLFYILLFSMGKPLHILKTLCLTKNYYYFFLFFDDLGKFPGLSA